MTAMFRWEAGAAKPECDESTSYRHERHSGRDQPSPRLPPSLKLRRASRLTRPWWMLGVMNGGSGVMNDRSGPLRAYPVLTGGGTASDSTFRGKPQIHSRVDALRHRDGVRHLVHAPGALDGQARAPRARRAERHRAPAHAEPCVLVYPGPARADHHGVRAAPPVRSDSLAATACAAPERRVGVLGCTHDDHDDRSLAAPD